MGKIIMWGFALLFLYNYFYGLIFDSTISATLVLAICCSVYIAAFLRFFGYSAEN